MKNSKEKQKDFLKVKLKTNTENHLELPDFNNRELSDKIIEMMESEAMKQIRKELPNLPKHVQEIQKSRGAGLESAIMCEQVLNHILTYMGNNKKKVVTWSFGEKIYETIKILKKNLKKDLWLDETIYNLQEIKKLRNIYAHVPGDYRSGKLRFDPSEEYYKKNEQDFRFKNLTELNKTFANLDEDIRKRTSEMLKRLVPIKEKQKHNII